jgi:uncharacterized membrane protein
MNAQKAVNIVGAVFVLAFFAVFIWQFMKIMPADTDGDGMGGMFRIFAVLIILMIALTAVRFMLIFRRTMKRGTSDGGVRARICASCSRNIDATAYSCPRCGAIQPPSADPVDAKWKR